MNFLPIHWWRTVFFLIPAITVYTIVLGAASIVSSLFDRRGYFAHGCARAWSWLILKTTGVRVTVEGLERVDAGHDLRLRVESSEHLRHAGALRSLPYQLRIIAKESLARFPVLGWHLKRGGHLFVDRRQPGSRRDPEALARAGVRGAVADHLRRGHAEPGRPRRALQGRKLSAGDRGRTAGRAARRHRHAPRDAEGPAADRAGRRDARSFTIPIPAPALEAPTVHDAKALADRVHAIVAATVERQTATCDRPDPL